MRPGSTSRGAQHAAPRGMLFLFLPSLCEKAIAFKIFILNRVHSKPDALAAGAWTQPPPREKTKPVNATTD